MQVQRSDRSCTIMQINDIQKHGSDSQYEEDEDISIEDDLEQDEEAKKKTSEPEWDFKEDDPEVQNAKLLEKYALMSGGMKLEEEEEKSSHYEQATVNPRGRKPHSQVEEDRSDEEIGYEEGQEEYDEEEEDDEQEVLFVDEMGRQLNEKEIIEYMKRAEQEA